MAEAVISIIAEKTIEILGSKAIETVGKLRNVKHELNALSETVSILKPVLDHAEEQYHQNPRIRVWVDQLKDALYEAQDVLEEFNIEGMRRELRGHNEMMKGLMTFFSSSNQLAFYWKKRDKVRALKVRIEAIAAKRSLLPLEERPERNREETHSFIDAGDFKGREDDKKIIMKFLLDSNVEENVSILPIVGIGGLGKTALAKFVYGDSKFDLKMWVCVSTDFDEKKLVKKILACAKEEEPPEDMLELLQRKLRAEIDRKKYLLVLDDVWDIEQIKWPKLKPLLVKGARGSKILVTTRIPLVAEIMGTAPPHFLGGLSERSSVELLMQVAGRKMEEIQDSGMLAIGKEIVRKCFGVPLVIRTVGSLLFLKKSELEWSQFKDDKLPKVAQKEDCIKSVLRLSYDYLPSHLKQCFAFCSLFPKDYEIKKHTLVNLWVAEGFIQPSNESQHLEDIAHEYFMDLLGRNFFQDFNINPYRNEETCKMHDLMHDLACLVAGNECLVARDGIEFKQERTRHISYGSTFNLMGKLSLSRLKASALRTFLSTIGYWEERESTSEADLHQLIQNFKRLRILDLHHTKVEKVPRSIYKLKHLTYLDLSKNCRLKRLPNSITRLQSLQTLNLHGCSDLEELPSDIRKLVSLRNLDIDKCLKLSYLPHGLGELSSLHRLTCFILPKDKTRAKNYCRLGELNGLNNIRGRLSIKNLRYVTNAEECENANLMGKHSLEFLELYFRDFGTDDVEIANRDEALLDGLKPPSNLQELTIFRYGDESFPSWIMNISKELTRLIEVSFYEFKRCKRLPQLGQLSHLKSLTIYNMPELEYIEWDQSSPSTALFPSLSELHISYCEKLKAVSLTPSGQSSTSTASFVSLSNLTIHGCEILEVTPLTPHLEDLTLTQCNGAMLINQMILGLNKLKKLFLWHAKFPGCLPEGFQSLTSLESLQIVNCPQLTSLSQSMRHLSSLEDLYIKECENLDISKDESGNILDFHGLHNLRFVKFWRLPKLTSFPQWLLQARNLEHLEISECKSLKDIPEQIEALQSLQNLVMNWCPSLTSFPEGMRKLTSLTSLSIHACGELGKRCKRQVGEDWDKIAHIPNKEF